jgi:DnaJ-class molecular chaperone
MPRCDNCEGKGSILGMGGMKRDCSHCKGSGLIPDEVAHEEVVAVKKRGRKPRVDTGKENN